MRYLQLKSLYTYPDLINHSDWEDFVQLVPVAESHMEARDEIKKLLLFPESNIYAYVGIYAGEALFMISFQKKNQSAMFVVCLINKKHQKASVSLSKWINRLDGVFRYLKINDYGFRLKKNLINTAPLFEVKKTERSFCYAKRQVISGKNGLVLGGGGARGAYQLGFWEYAREKKWTYDVITGTSVGALNGALMVQDDWQSAKSLWHQIETKDILLLPQVDTVNSYYFSSLLRMILNMIKEAWKNQGISIEPLEKQLKTLLDTNKIAASSTSFFVITTHAKTFKEYVIDIKKESPKKQIDWLLASSSFFPALTPRKIEGEVYVDGGYCNNIPVDIAVEHGVLDLSVVDVKGPGITKKYDVPLNITPLVVKNPWSLGNMLLFDHKRAIWNQQLGYLETKRYFDRMTGYWYTFNVPFMSRDYQKINQNIIQGLLSDTSIAVLKKIKILSVLKKLRILYQNEVSSYNLGWVVLELAGKYYEMDPSVCYTYETFCQKLLKKSRWYPITSPLKLYSLQEWLNIYQNRFLFMNTHERVLSWQKLFKNTRHLDVLSLIGLLGDIDIYFTARLIDYLRKTSERGIYYVKRI